MGSEALRAGARGRARSSGDRRASPTGWARRSPAGYALDVARRYLDDIVLVDDATILGGLRFALERMKQVLEPAGAAALAAVLTGAVPIRDGERVAVVLSGGNVATDRLGELLA